MTKKHGAEALDELLAPYARQSEADLRQWLVEQAAPATLAEALKYSVLGAGKRLRPAMVLMACRAVGGPGEPDEMTRRAAVAVELVHAYSLVHDDLPAMDDDTLRRGRPTVHVRYGEAMAILVGDALLTRAFGLLAARDDGRSCGLVRELARGAGSTGMIAGQVADMRLCEVPQGLQGLRYIHHRKTGALIRASARMGAICGGGQPGDIEAITSYAELVGLVYQLVDDILDVTADAEKLGKTPGKDARAGKKTCVSEMGLRRAAESADEFTKQAVAALEPLGQEAQNLRELALLLAQRTH